MAVDTRFTDILNMSALGDKLREVREAKNLTLGQAQKQTRIHQTVLKALEDGKCDSILNPAYEKSFLRKYAEYLGIDSRQVLSEYKKFRPDAEPRIANRLSEPEAHSKNSPGIMPFIKLITIVAVLITLAMFAGGKIVSYLKGSHSSKRAIASKAKRSPSQAKSLKATSLPNSASKAPPAEMAIPKNVQIKLLLKVNKNVLIKMKTDGVLLFERELTKGTAEIFTADRAINIYAANGESIELIINGKSMGSPGKGTLKNIEITRSGIKLK